MQPSKEALWVGACYKQNNVPCFVPPSFSLKAMQHPLISLLPHRPSLGEALPSLSHVNPSTYSPQRFRLGWQVGGLTRAFLQVWELLAADFQIVFERDPAAHHWLEVLCCYPGFHALLFYRLAHWLHHHHIIFLPRLLSHLARFFTGIEIHPGATIGKGVFIDHGMGVVIGETAIVGDYCLIYQGVTLGGTGKEVGKRHPTLGQHVVVGAGAKVLGNIHIGDYARVGAGSIVLRAVPSHCTAVGVPGRNLCQSNIPACPLDHGQVPDADAEVIRILVDRIETLEQQLQWIRQQLSP
jgi:serine O-acetyltransferase